MDNSGANKKYEASKIPLRQSAREEGTTQSYPQIKPHAPVSLSEGIYYELEYEAGPMGGAGKLVPEPQKIKEPEKDEIRDLFGQMRDLAREPRSTYAVSRFFDGRTHYGNEAVFYKQGMFMKDFIDNYTGNAPFFQYFPYYQMMGYEQLRTYFTWRTEVRKGNVSDTSLSYAFLYIYELLGNIGVSGPEEGLEKLLSFWKAFRLSHRAIDKYMLSWLKEYHIYYELPHSFQSFVEENKLTEHYPGLKASDGNFDLFCAISKYDIRKSAFFSADRAKLITDCFYFVTDELRQICTEKGIHFEESIFQPTKKMSVWRPFQKALFYDWKKQTDRQIVFSENEMYLCSQNRWTYSSVITTESGRQLIGYVMKQLESALRKLTNYKFPLSANIHTVALPLLWRLSESEHSLEIIVNSAVLKFYREATKTVVKVDPGALSIIRKEALATQEKLIVSEREEALILLPEDKPPQGNTPTSMSDVWKTLKSTLTANERKALFLILNGETELKAFADECGLMLEVLVDGLNEKAMDAIGDNLVDEDFALYEDYREQVKELLT